MKNFKKLILTIAFFSYPLQEAIADDAIAEQKSLILLPAANLFLPGLGQAIDGDYKKSIFFFTYAIAGFSLYTNAKAKEIDFQNNDSGSYHNYRDTTRVSSIGSSMGKHAALLSIYDTFSTRVASYKRDGKYTFLPANQNIETISKAPFQFHFLSNWTTWAPLTLAIYLGANNFGRSPNPSGFTMRPIDATTSTYESYVAGTSEEALFRGWAYPVLYENTKSYWLSNSVQALGFAYVHDIERPYWQLAFGLYSGWLTQKNSWDMSEAIFIHAWWDFFVIGAAYARERSFTKDFNVSLPMFSSSF